jgi:hypothetical protein
MKKIAVDKKNVVEINNGILMGYTTKDQINTHIVGQLSLDETLDMLNTVQYEFLNTFVKHALEKQPQLTEKDIRKQLYDRSVMGYSLMIDRFKDEVLCDRQEQSPLPTL